MRLESPSTEATPPDIGATESREALLSRIHDLQVRLEEMEEAMRAFTSGEVDAIVAPGPGGDQIFTLKGADETYRVMVEKMAEGTRLPDRVHRLRRP